MDITISMLNGTSHTLRVHPEDTVGSLKILIQERLGVLAATQKLVFVNGMNTDLSDDSRPLGSYGLRHGAKVSLLVTQPATIQVFLRNEKGTVSTYDIKPEETVSHFKTRVESRERIPVSQQRLIHQGREMTQGRLSDYDVGAMSTIDLNLRLRGG